MAIDLSIEELKVILNEVCELAHSKGDPFVSDNGRWTREILEGLGSLGKSKNFYVCASGIENHDWGEWLYDMTWLEYHNDGKDHIKRVPLAVESEWGNHGDILDDFQKLVISRAECRVMIFQAKSESEMNDILEMLGKSVGAFSGRSATDRYYCACYLIDSGRFEYRDAIVG